MRGLRIRTWQAATLFLAASAVHAGSIGGKVACTGLRSNAGAVVYIEKIAGKTFPPPAEPVLMDQKGKEFIPRVLPVLVGTTVAFRNGDGIDHNVFTPDYCADKFNLGAWRTDEKRTHTFGKPCAAVMLCKIHPEMAGYVVVVETPYFAVTDADGRYTVPNVPDGAYTVSVWHERLKKASQAVTVKGDVTADFTLGR